MADNPSKFYLTTPIYYVNARPHIGHAYTTIVADVVARRHRLLGDDTYLLTGTDEHGQKIERSAAAAGVPPQQFADQVAASFEALWKRLGITYNKFIRTTDPAHKRGVQKLFRDLYARGAIYLDSYTGAYCVSDEAFVDLPAGTPCPDCGRPLEIITEENFFFKLSEFQLPLINLIESNELHIQPESRRNEVLSFLRGPIPPQNSVILSEAKNPRIQPEAPPTSATSTLATSALGNPYVPGALKDLSISRSSFTWGVPVPEPAASEAKEKHVIYVWLDALANYMTAIGYGSEDPLDIEKFEHYWPADLHLVGKEIIRFHCVYWPAFLMALRPPEFPEAEWNPKWLPKSVVAHGWLLFEESKMSKSRGNIVRTETILDAFGPLCPAPPQPSPLLLSSRSEAEGSASPAPPQPPTKAQQDLFAADILRYFLLREIPFGQDGSFSFDALIQRYNSDLANGYGNLVSRTLTMVNSSFSGYIPTYPYDPPSEPSTLPLSLLFEKKANSTDFFSLLKDISGFIGLVDGKITSEAPWKLAKSPLPEDREKLSSSLYTACEAIRVITAYLYPILPYATASVWAQLGLGSIEEAASRGDLKNLEWGGLKPGTKLGPLAPIFPRADKGLAQTMTEMESPPSPQPASPDVPAPAPTPEKSVPSVLSLSPTEATETISIDDFAKVDLRVAQIVVAERIPKADKLLRLEVDLGYERRQILAGIAEYYAPETLIGRKVVIVANLAPRKMRGLESNGMIVAASIGPEGRPVLAGFLEDVELGARLK